MRSWPRRYGDLLLPHLDADDDPTDRIGPEGVSALDIALETVRTWELLTNALERVNLEDSPVLHPAVLDRSRRQWDRVGGETIASVHEQLSDRAVALAELVATIDGAGWNRMGRVAGGGSMTALGIAREAVDVGADALRRIERLVGSFTGGTDS